MSDPGWGAFCGENVIDYIGINLSMTIADPILQQSVILYNTTSSKWDQLK